MTDADDSNVSFVRDAGALLLTACGGGEAESSREPSQQQPDLPKNELEVHDPWVRPAPAGGNSALYLTLLNGTSTADTLVDVEAPIIGSVEIHQSVDSAGTSMMRPMGTSVAIPPKSRVMLEPGGKHVMLLRLQQPLADGESIVLNLDFAQAGLRRIQAPIRTQAPSPSNPQ